MTTTTTTAENSEIDHIVASEQHRLRTFDVFPDYPIHTRRQLAIAGFLYRQLECVCPFCGVQLDLKDIDENVEYPANHFRKIHRTKISSLGKRCPFLLCEVGTNIDDLHPPLTTQQQPIWDDAEDPEYANYNTRLESFKTWSETQQNHIQAAQQTYVTPQNMARHGFYFSGPNDGVTCFYCGNTLMDWSAAMASTNEHIVQLEHARFFPCRFITCSAGGKFVTNAGYFHSVSAQERRDRNPMRGQPTTTTDSVVNIPQTIDECLSTFETWPSTAPVSAQALAETGFYYLGKDLTVKCFKCDLEVADWRHGMTALGTHRKRRNDCPIVLAMDSAKTGDIQTVNEKWRLETLAGLSFNKTKANSPGQAERDQRLCRELAACGFYRVKNSKNIRCAYCGVTIEPQEEPSIMAQHRYLAKQCIKRRNVSADDSLGLISVDCLIVRAQCPANIVIPHREPFPEFREFQSIFDRIESFDTYKRQKKLTDVTIRSMAEAGFFFDDPRRMRCFQCGNSLPINDRARQEKFPHYTMAQIHAHYYPTCEWVKEILGVKYIAQVLHDRFKSNESITQNQSSVETILSETSINNSSNESVTATMMTPATTDITSPSSVHRFDEFIDSDQSAESSDEDGFETVVPPPTTYIYKPQEIRSPPPSAAALGTTTTDIAETCSDSEVSLNRSQLTSPIMAAHINPFKQLAEQNLQHREHSENSFSSDGGAPEMSPSISSSPAVSSLSDVRCSLAHESNRLETFKRLGRDTFAHVPVAELAYAGFYLNGEGDRIECPWCQVKLSEERIETVMKTRPSVARAGVIDEPWTAMRVHRHENGLIMGQRHSWCTWVRRETSGLFPNVTLLQSQMLYPEYPSYSRIETRIESFTAEWNYPSGSRLSNQIMAQAGFFYMGGDSVCCYYCGNKLQKFEPRDCPFEEHATFYPLCDYIQRIRGIDYVNRILLENGRIPQGRLKYEMDGSQKIKRIVFDKSGVTKRKNERLPVNRINSYTSRSSSIVPRRSSSQPSQNDPKENIEDTCLICTERAATHEYDPCRHFPMCGECFAKLDGKHLENCMICFQPATVRIRVPTTPLTQ